MRTRDSLALALAISMIVGLRPAVAYDDIAHRQIVADAFEFMLSERRSTAPYADGATGVSDFQLLQRTLAKNTSQPDAELRAAASTLAQGVVDTDRLPDLTLNVAGLGDSTDFLGRVSFTLFSHFVNVHAPGTLWTESGYSWRWVESNQKCSHSNLEDHFSNFFSGRYPATLVLAKSPAEVVNDCETPTERIYCRASAVPPAAGGGLIHAAVGIAGGVGGFRTKRSGWAA
jgi:hypothetical protein